MVWQPIHAKETWLSLEITAISNISSSIRFIVILFLLGIVVALCLAVQHYAELCRALKQ